MVKFKVDNKEFTMRAAGIILNNGKVLFQKRKDDKYWALPGGKVELMEKSQDTVVREIEEELAIKNAKVERLLYLNELFFNFKGTDVHQVAFYYLVTLPEDAYIIGKEGIWDGVEEDKDIIYTWLELSNIENELVQPLFLNQELKNITTTVKHLIQDEINV